jgi:membrane fusion protein, heavy metal efflux system
MFPRMMNGRASIAIIALLAIAVVVYGAWRFSLGSKAELGSTAHASAEAGDTPNAPPREKDSVDLSDSQLASVKVEPLEDRDFPVEKEAIGSIDFDEEMAVQVFTPYQGRFMARSATT